MAKDKDKKISEEQRKEYIDWILREWDCQTVEQAKRAAMKDLQLHLELRKVGIEFDDLKTRIEKALGRKLSEFDIERTSVKFRTDGDCTLTFAKLNALSVELGTEAINFNFGFSGEPDLSEVTPGCSSSCGWIEVMFPIDGHF